MRTYVAVLKLLIVMSSSVWAIGIDEWGLRTQPDGTTFEAHVFGDEFVGHQLTADGYEFVYGSDGWYYYAELDAQGEYRASPYKVGIDDPASNFGRLTPGKIKGVFFRIGCNRVLGGVEGRRDLNDKLYSRGVMSVH